MLSQYYYAVLIGHTFLTLFMILGCLSNNQVVLKIVFAFLIVGITLFFLLGGCFISRLEKKLSGGNDYTIIDPLLHGLGVNIDRRARTYMTIALFMGSLSITSYKIFLKPTQFYKVTWFTNNPRPGPSPPDELEKPYEEGGGTRREKASEARAAFGRLRN